MKSIIALDIGKKRTGIAKSDNLGIAVNPYDTIETILLLDEVIKIEKEFGIEKLIIGIPFNIEGGSKETEEFIKNKSKEIQGEFSKIEIIFINESFSSREAEARLKDRGVKISKYNKALIDQEAAAILLEQYFRENT